MLRSQYSLRKKKIPKNTNRMENNAYLAGGHKRGGTSHIANVESYLINEVWCVFFSTLYGISNEYYTFKPYVYYYYVPTTHIILL